MTNTETVYAHIAATVRRGRQPGSFKDIGIALTLEVGVIQEAVKACRSQGWLEMRKGPEKYDPLVYTIIGETHEPIGQDRWVIDDNEYDAIVFPNGESMSYLDFMDYEAAQTEIGKAARRLISGSATAAQRQLLIDSGVPAERVAKVHLDAIERRVHKTHEPVAKALAQIGRAV